jgi:hypothetical protein
MQKNFFFHISDSYIRNYFILLWFTVLYLAWRIIYLYKENYSLMNWNYIRRVPWAWWTLASFWMSGCMWSVINEDRLCLQRQVGYPLLIASNPPKWIAIQPDKMWGEHQIYLCLLCCGIAGEKKIFDSLWIYIGQKGRPSTVKCDSLWTKGETLSHS